MKLIKHVMAGGIIFHGLSPPFEIIIGRRKNSHNMHLCKSAHVEMNENCCLILHKDEEHEARQQSLSVWHLAAGVAAADRQRH